MNIDFLCDYKRMTGEDYRIGVRSLITILFSHQIRFMYWWRKAKRKMTPFRKLILHRFSRKYGLEISINADIRGGLILRTLI